MNLPEQVDRILGAETDDFFKLVDEAELDPKTDLVGADLRGLDLPGRSWAGCNLTRVNFGNAILDGSDFSDAVLVMAKFSGASAVGVKFTRADLTEACLQRGNFEQSDFRGAILVGVDLQSASTIGAIFTDADLTSVQGESSSPVPSKKTLIDLLIEELQDVYSAEMQITVALPKMVNAASSPELKQVFQAHLQETRGQVKRLEQIFQILKADPGDSTCEATQGHIEEAEELIGGGHSPEVLDVALVMSAQKVEHYEIASYGSLRTLAETCGMTEVAQLLQQTLEEEKATDEKLNQIAEGEVNAKALQAA